MDNDEIIRMAREAGFEPNSSYTVLPMKDYASNGILYELERFAALVAAHAKSEQINLAYQQGYEEGSAHEREACAKVCDEYAEESSNPMNFAENCAAAIRARGDK